MLMSKSLLFSKSCNLAREEVCFKLIFSVLNFTISSQGTYVLSDVSLDDGRGSWVSPDCPKVY